MTPKDDLAQRVATLFSRRLTTPWSEKETRKYKQIVTNYSSLREDLELIERYYVYQRRKGDKGIHRRDLFTFLNNFAGELDRAIAWDEDKRRHMSTPVDRKVNDQSDEDWKRVSDLAKAEMERFKNQFKI